MKEDKFTHLTILSNLLDQEINNVKKEIKSICDEKDNLEFQLQLTSKFSHFKTLFGTAKFLEKEIDSEPNNFKLEP